MNTLGYLSRATVISFQTGCLSVLKRVEQTEQNQAAFQASFEDACASALAAYMEDPANKISTMKVFGPGGASLEETQAHATHFAQFFIQKGKEHIEALIGQGTLTLAPTQNSAEA